MTGLARMQLLCLLCVIAVAAWLPHAYSLAVHPIQQLRPRFAQPMARSQSALRSPARHANAPQLLFHRAAIFIPSSSSSTSLRNDLRDEIEQAAQRRAYESRARGVGAVDSVGGAVLGAMLGGPFGALFGAQIGASIGAASRLDKERKEEMKRKGITPEMLDQATEIGVALKQAVEGLRAAEESVETSRRLAKSLDRQEKSLYERAKSAIQSGDEEGARKYLLERESVKEKLLKVLKSVSEEQKRLSIMKDNVEALETRGLEIESLLRRSVGAAALQNSADIGFSLEAEDPLLKKFRDLGM